MHTSYRKTNKPETNVTAIEMGDGEEVPFMD